MASNEFTGGDPVAGPPETFPDVQQAPLEPQPRVEFMRVFSYVFENPHWLMTLIIGGLCYLSQSVIPVVGGLLFLGYQFEVTEALLRNKGASYPEFDFNRFSDYLMRGLWPFLVSLVVAVVIMLPMAILMMVMMGLFAAVAESGDREIAGLMMVVVMAAFGFFMMVMGVVVALFVTPMMLRAGLTQQFGEAFKFGWAKDFVGRTWREMVLFWLFLMAASLILAPLGLAMFCVGVYAVSALLVLAQGHIYYQLYSLYLARGGEPLPLEPPIK